MDVKIHLWEEGGLPTSLVHRASPVPLADGFCCESWEPGSEAGTPGSGTRPTVPWAEGRRRSRGQGLGPCGWWGGLSTRPVSVKTYR